MGKGGGLGADDLWPQGSSVQEWFVNLVTMQLRIDSLFFDVH